MHILIAPTGKVIWLDREKISHRQDILPVFTTCQKAQDYLCTFAQIGGFLPNNVTIQNVTVSWLKDYCARKDLAYTLDHPGKGEEGRNES